MIGIIPTKYLAIALGLSLAALAGAGWMLKGAWEAKAEARAEATEERAKNTDLRTHIERLAQVRSDEARKLAEARRLTNEINEARRRDQAERRVKREQIKAEILAAMEPNECLRAPYPDGVLVRLRDLSDAANLNYRSAEATNSGGSLELN